MRAGAWHLSIRWLMFALLLCAGAAGCATWKWNASRVELPDKHTVPLDQLVIHSNFKLPSQQRLLQEINAQRVDVSTKLGLPVSDEKIHIYLFRDGQQFYDFMRQRFPRFPDRRAFFVESDTRLTVYAHWGDRVAEDLRHEVSHGYLHSVLQNLPLWLDEGLAEYFEVPRGTHGSNAPHIVELAALAKDGRWRPDLRRLEAIRLPAEMTQTDYAEGWAWVHWLLETDPARKTLLQEYLADLRRTGMPMPLSLYLRRLDGNPEQELFDYVRGLEGKR